MTSQSLKISFKYSSLVATTAFAVLLYALLSPKSSAEQRLSDPSEQRELVSLDLGGVKQWLQIRTHHSDNPILLILHGGPGIPEMPLSYQFETRLEEKFIVVHWDQRGAGKSASLFLPAREYRIDKYLDDTHAVVQWLKQRFHVEKIFLAGHSWGSYLGAVTAARHPEDFYAYIGISQLVHALRGEQISKQFVLDAAQNAGNTDDISTINALEGPPYKSLYSVLRERTLLNKYGGGILHGEHHAQPIRYFAKIMYGAPEYSAWDFVMIGFGVLRSVSLLMPSMFDIDTYRDAPSFEMPVYLISGQYDYNVPWELAAEYCAKIKAPYKEFIVFDHSAHAPNFEEPERFAEELTRIKNSTLLYTQP